MTLLATPVLYEVASGIALSRSRSETEAFRSLVAKFAIVAFDELAAAKAAEVRAELVRLGRTKSHIDVMIAGMALAGGHTLVTRDKDFDVISAALGLQLEAY